MEKYTLETIFEIEPGLKEIAKRAVSMKRAPVQKRHRAYIQAKIDAWELIGWEARDPRLANSRAWDCYFRDYILKELRI